MPPQHRRDRAKAKLIHSKQNTEPCNLMFSSWDLWWYHQIPIVLGSATSPTVPAAYLASVLNQCHSVATIFSSASPAHFCHLWCPGVFLTLILHSPNFTHSPFGSSIQRIQPFQTLLSGFLRTWCEPPWLPCFCVLCAYKNSMVEMINSSENRLSLHWTIVVMVSMWPCG
jgi:hypothetical protein